MTEKCKGTLTLFGSVGLIVGFVIGASIFVIIPSLASMTGPSLYLAYLIAAIPSIFSALYLIQLSGALPVTGAHYIAISRWISPVSGIYILISFILGIICILCLVAWGCATYLSTYLPDVPPVISAIFIILLFSIINWIGIKVFEKLQIIMMLFFILAMLVFGIGGILNIKTEFQTPLFPYGYGNFFIAVGIATFSWLGLSVISEVAGEVKNPRHNIPLSILISVIIIGILYSLQAFALTGNMHWSEAGKIGPTAVLVTAGKFLPDWCVYFISLGAIFAMLTTINALILTGTREIYTLTSNIEKYNPNIFNYINPKYKTPRTALPLITILSIIGILFAVELEKYAAICVQGSMLFQILGATAVLRMPKLAPDTYKNAQIKFPPFWRWVIWGGCVLSSAAIFIFCSFSSFITGVVLLIPWLIIVVFNFMNKLFIKWNIKEELE